MFYVQNCKGSAAVRKDTSAQAHLIGLLPNQAEHLLWRSLVEIMERCGQPDQLPALAKNQVLEERKKKKKPENLSEG